MNRHSTGLTLLAMLVTAALAACSRPEPLAEPVRAVKTLVVGAGSVGSALEYAAEVRPRTESRLSFRIGGKLVERRVDLGAAVRPGQVLARVDPQDLRLSQEAAAAAQQAAEVQVELAQADFQRFLRLFEQGFISRAELDRRETTLKAARAQAAQARAQSGVQGNLASYSTLVADAAGVVTAVDAEPGAVVSPGMPILRVALDGPRDVAFSVPEDRLPLVRSLQGHPGAVRFALWSAPSRELPATVREIAAAADPASRTYVVKADVGSAAVALGQTATVRLALPTAPGLFRLPLSAVMQHQGRSTVWLVDAATSTVHPQPVDVAGAEGNEVLVSAGLTAGQRVVAAGVHVLSAGQEVRLAGEGPAVAPQDR